MTNDKVKEDKPNYPEIHLINNKYYNWNGKNPDKPLTVPYAKRLLSIQKRYGDIVDTKTASGHGKLKQKKKFYDDIISKKNSRTTKKASKTLEQFEKQKLLEGIKNKTIDSKNLRTRFRAGFRPYDIDEDGNILESYTSISHARALNGVIPLGTFLKDLPNKCFDENTRGGFKIVVYDSVTHKVHYSYEYGEQD